MSIVTNPPRGLISIFGLNDMGSVPKELTDQIVGTFDISELCLLNRELVTGTVNTAGVGAQIMLTVPAGELWYIWSASVGPNNPIAVGASLRFHLDFTTQGQYIAASLPGTAAAGTVAASFLDRPAWLGPGAGLGLTVEEETGAAKTMRYNLVIVRLRI